MGSDLMRASDTSPSAGEESRPLERESFRYSVVIPVFNSEPIVGTTVERTVEFLRSTGLEFEIILVNDGSTDGSWEVIRRVAESSPEVVAIDLLRNVGQHTANLCGFRQATGDFVVTMDDDLQNPPEEIIHLIDRAMEGFDVVYGEYDQKRAPGLRILGSRLIALVNRRIFGQPRDLVVTNFRILSRDVVDRIAESPTAFPYITGQSLLYSQKRANVLVRHDPRPAGKSSYTAVRLLKLVFRILFSYSSYPLRLMAGVGAVVAGVSFLMGLVALLRALIGGTSVPGWPSVVVLIAFLNGVMIMMLSMLGEYVARVLNQLSRESPYIVVARAGRE